MRETIRYIRDDFPDFELPAYPGDRYEALVPDTLDLQERAALAVNGLTGPTDPEADYEIYWKVFFRTNPPMMRHDYNDQIQPKFIEALPLMRLISGSDLNMHVERRWLEVTLQSRGPDGLIYQPKTGRPWIDIEYAWPTAPFPSGDQYTCPFYNGRYLGALTAYYLLTGDELWKETAENVIQGLQKLVQEEGLIGRPLFGETNEHEIIRTR